MNGACEGVSTVLELGDPEAILVLVVPLTPYSWVAVRRSLRTETPNSSSPTVLPGHRHCYVSRDPLDMRLLQLLWVALGSEAVDKEHLRRRQLGGNVN